MERHSVHCTVLGVGLFLLSYLIVTNIIRELLGTHILHIWGLHLWLWSIMDRIVMFHSGYKFKHKQTFEDVNIWSFSFLVQLSPFCTQPTHLSGLKIFWLSNWILPKVHCSIIALTFHVQI